MELSFLGTRLLPVSCGGTLRALAPRPGWPGACGMWLCGKASRWMVFLRTGMRGDTAPGSLEGCAGRPSRWLWEKEVPGPGAPRGCISKPWSIQVFRLPLRQSTERGPSMVRCWAWRCPPSPPGQQLTLPVGRGLTGGLSGPQWSTYVPSSSPPTAPPVTYLHTPHTRARSHTPLPRYHISGCGENVPTTVASRKQAAPVMREPGGPKCVPSLYGQLRGGHILVFRDSGEGQW